MSTTASLSASNGCSAKSASDCDDKDNIDDRIKLLANQDKSGEVHATSMHGKFKEKRPEPLNLNPSLNQEIPLDLSVKSACHLPSGRFANIFSAKGQRSTLDTPHIFWQDNEALLAKPRLFSSSSTIQKLQLPSSAGISPPKTPTSPFMNSPIARSTGQLQSLSRQQRFQFGDNLLSNKASPSTTKFFAALHRAAPRSVKATETKRRSCSTDNLNFLGVHNHTSVDKLQYNPRESIRKFSPNINKESLNPTNNNYLGYPADQASCVEKEPASAASIDSTQLICQQPHSVVQTSLASATANLLNIHLSSPTNQQRSNANHLLVSTQISNNGALIGSSTTLNTPTLVSPSQFRFINSPKLSPVGFEFSPPFASLSPQASTFEQRFSNLKSSPTNVKIAERVSIDTDEDPTNKIDIVSYTSPKAHTQCVTISEPNLSHLITSARDKVGTYAVNHEEMIEEIQMDVENHDFSTQHQQQQRDFDAQSRPATVIPTILVSESNRQQHISVELNRENTADTLVSNQKPVQNRTQRTSIGKRALSPHSFKSQVDQYHTERLSSSSAPPEIQQVKARSKIKSATDSCVNLGSNLYQTTNDLQDAKHLHSTAQIRCNQYKINPPLTYPEMQIRWMPNHMARSSVELTHSNNTYQLPHQTSSNDMCHSAQQLEMHSLASKPQHLDPFIRHQYQSSSLGNVGNRTTYSGPYFRGQIEDNQLTLHQQRGAQPIPSQLLCETLPISDNNNNSPIVVDLNEPNIQATIRAQQTFAPNTITTFCQPAHLSQPSYHHDTHQQSNQIQQTNEPRALSADANVMTLSESSCSSTELYFRSSSAAPGTSAKKYHCDLCSKAFTRSDMLTRHKRLHSGDRPFQCGDCKQSFSRSDHLSTHMRTHTGEKPYRCKLCSYSACRKDMITRHMKVHNRSSINV